MLASSFNNISCLNKDIYKHNTRSSSNIHKIQARTNYQKRSVKHKGIVVWNNLTNLSKKLERLAYSGKKIKTRFLLKY